MPLKGSPSVALLGAVASAEAGSHSSMVKHASCAKFQWVDATSDSDTDIPTYVSKIRERLRGPKTSVRIPNDEQRCSVLFTGSGRSEIHGRKRRRRPATWLKLAYFLGRVTLLCPRHVMKIARCFVLDQWQNHGISDHDAKRYLSTEACRLYSDFEFLAASLYFVPTRGFVVWGITLDGDSDGLGIYFQPFAAARNYESNSEPLPLIVLSAPGTVVTCCWLVTNYVS